MLLPLLVVGKHLWVALVLLWWLLFVFCVLCLFVCLFVLLLLLLPVVAVAVVMLFLVVVFWLTLVLMLLLFVLLLLLLGVLAMNGGLGREQELKHPSPWEQAAGPIPPMHPQCPAAL